jgi:tetratricopeptide (TPR) repeat protein
MLRLIFITSLISTVARAEIDPQTERARAHVKAAIAYYDEAKYDDAAREMSAAYQLKPLPDLQYNLAQCYERLGKLDDAVKAYETYLAGQPTSPDKKRIELRIENLRERAKAQAAGQAVPAAPVEKIVLKTIVVYKEVPPPPGRVARWAAYGLWVVAAAGAATGIAYAVLASQAAKSVTNGGSTTNPMQYDPSTQDSGKTDVIVSYVSFGIGAVALAGGIGLWYAARKLDREAPKLTLAPSFAPSFAGLAAQVRF